jgi:hypothetical protein
VLLLVTDTGRDHRPRPTDHDAELLLYQEVLRRSWNVTAGSTVG